MIAHQDVAGAIAADLVERLRNWDHGIPKTMIVSEAADLIESQAQALSEAEAEIARLKANPPLLDAKSLPRVDALVKSLESRLAEAMRVIEPIVSRLEWDGYMQRWTLKPDMPAGSITAAHGFLNAAKEKTNAQ